MTGIVSVCIVPVAALVGIVFLLCGSGQPFVAATFDLDDDPQPTIINVINATPQASVCGQPTNATQLASNATVCGVAVPRPEFLRQFANAGELLRFNCQNPSRPFFLLANATCSTFIATSAQAVGAQVPLV